MTSEEYVVERLNKLEKENQDLRVQVKELKGLLADYKNWQDETIKILAKCKFKKEQLPLGNIYISSFQLLSNEDLEKFEDLGLPYYDTITRTSYGVEL